MIEYYSCNMLTVTCLCSLGFSFNDHVLVQDASRWTPNRLDKIVRAKGNREMFWSISLLMNIIFFFIRHLKCWPFGDGRVKYLLYLNRWLNSYKKLFYKILSRIVVSLFFILKIQFFDIFTFIIWGKIVLVFLILNTVEDFVMCLMNYKLFGQWFVYIFFYFSTFLSRLCAFVQCKIENFFFRINLTMNLNFKFKG